MLGLRRSGLQAPGGAWLRSTGSRRQDGVRPNPASEPHGGVMDTVSIDSRSLYSLLGSPRAPTLLDTRRDKAYDADDRLIPGALRTGPDPLAITKDHPRCRPIVVYCVYGHEVGQDAAAMLRAQGFDARHLE